MHDRSRSRKGNRLHTDQSEPRMDSLVEFRSNAPLDPFQIRWQSVRREQLRGCGPWRASEVRTNCLERRPEDIHGLCIGRRLRFKPTVGFQPRHAESDHPIRGLSDRVICISSALRLTTARRLSRCTHADGCFRMSAKARNRAASAVFVDRAAFFSKDGAMALNFATLFLFMCELSAPLIAVRRAAIRSAGKACDLSNWSR